MLFRLPLVEGVNDSDQNITDTARFIAGLRDDAKIEVLPYHRLGVGKYATLERPYEGESFKTPPPERLETVKRIFEKHGVDCIIGK